MAQIKQIQFKRSDVAGKRPTALQLAEGELAINLKDRMLFTKDSTGAVVDLGFAKGGNVDGNVVQVGNYTQTGDFNQTGNTTVSGTVKAGKIDGTEYTNIEIKSAKPTIKGTTPTGSWELTTENNTPLFPKLKVTSLAVAAITGSTQITEAHIDMLTIGNILPVASGGTGADNDVDARANLNAAVKGENDDITNLKALVGPLTLGGDPVGSTDATTKRYVDNAIAAGGGGSGGATMNGIMNYGVGTPHMAASRAFIYPYDVTLDGQLLERAKYPELWVFAQMLTPIDDATWLADPTQRGKYSLGDGSTTFRVPDWNGVQDGSVPGLFFRGGKTSASDMTIALNGAPNITGEMTVNLPSFGYVNVRTNGGAIYNTGNENVITSVPSPGFAPGWGNLTFFDASRSNPAYGRSTEVSPNKISGVWVVRANGAFTATNTSWSVMNSVANATAGQIVLGGKVISYVKADNKETRAVMEAEKTVNLKAAIRFSIQNPDNAITTVWQMQETGQAVNVVANAGANTNITSLTALSGPLRLGGDAVGDYDAVTLRQARNMGGGGSGPTMSGIMNYDVGKPGMAASRAIIAPYEVPLDGQLLERAKWPDLWAYAQRVTPIDDSVWLATPSERGNYSNGDGSTTFRVPDWNGVQVNSIPGVFFRGGRGVNDMKIALNAAPNITGEIVLITRTGTVNPGSGAFAGTTNRNNSNEGGNVRGIDKIVFNAQDSNSTYGRDNTSEIVPNRVSGVWVVRASGGFIAANTSWSVINGDATIPDAGTTVVGGDVISSYRINNKSYSDAYFRSYAVVGGQSAAAIIVADRRDEANPKDSYFHFFGNGGMAVGTGGYAMENPGISFGAPNTGFRIGDVNNPSWIRFTSLGTDIVGMDANNLYTMEGKGIISNGDLKQDNDAFSTWVRDVYIRSDIRVKTDLKKFENPEETLSQMDGYLYLQKKGFKENGEINWEQSAGLIAQEVQAQLPELVVEDEDTGLLRLNYNGVIALNTSTINKHTSRINELEARIKELEKLLK